MPFDAPPQTDLKEMQVLLVHGKRDPFRPLAESLTPYLRRMHADVQEHWLEAGHELTLQDLEVTAGWLRDQTLRLATRPQRT